MQVTKRGFTLIELLVVISIIGLLASIVLASLGSAREKARDARRMSDLHTFRTALELYASSNNGYPNTSSAFRSQCAGWGSYAANSVIPGLVPTYIPAMPADPDMNVSANLNCYIYISDGTDYNLLDFNIVAATPASNKTFVDPKRNVGTAWANNAACPGTIDTAWGWAIWSGPGSVCW